MKKILILGLNLIILTTQLYAGMDQVHSDAKISAFFPTGHTFRQIYGTCLIDYEFEIGKIFLKNYEIWTNVDWTSATGHTHAFHNRTRFENFNVSLGGKYIVPIHKQVKFYVGLGINGAFVQVHNHSPYVKKDVHKNGVGGVAKLGFYFEPVDHLFLEIFTDYLYQSIRFEQTVQIGGFKTGGGIGFCF